MTPELNYRKLEPCAGFDQCPICGFPVTAIREGGRVLLGQKCCHVVSFFARPEMTVGYSEVE